MAELAAVAEEYFSSLNPMAARIHSDIVETKNAYETLWDTLNDVEKSEILDECIIKPEIAIKYAFLDSLDIDLESKGFDKSDLLSYFDLQCGQKVIRDESTKFRDEHSSPFSYHTKSQLDLCQFSEKRAAKKKANKTASILKNDYTTSHSKVEPSLNSELALSHSKVVSELKNALKSTDKKISDDGETRDNYEFSPKPSKVIDEINSAGGFISKLIGNKRTNRGNLEEREYLVSPERQCQIVASSDNYFKTGFNSRTVDSAAAESVTEAHSFREMQSPAGLKGMAAYRSNSGLEEAHALLGVGSCKSGDTESSLCDTDDSIPPSLPKTGLDFLDNW